MAHHTSPAILSIIVNHSEIHKAGFGKFSLISLWISLNLCEAAYFFLNLFCILILKSVELFLFLNCHVSQCGPHLYFWVEELTFLTTWYTHPLFAGTWLHALLVNKPEKGENAQLNSDWSFEMFIVQHWCTNCNHKEKWVEYWLPKIFSILDV